MLKVIYSAVILYLLWSSPLSAQAQEYQPFPEYTEFAQANPSTMALFEVCQSTEPSLQTVNELIEQGADVNAQLPDPFAGMTPLVYAVQTDQDGAIITALLEAGADLDAQDVHERTALMRATTKGIPSCTGSPCGPEPRRNSSPRSTIPTSRRSYANLDAKTTSTRNHANDTRSPVTSYEKSREHEHRFLASRTHARNG